METIDFHAHLLSPHVDFSRAFDKVALSLFEKKLGVDKKKLIDKKYEGYVDAFIHNVSSSQYIKKSVLLPVDGKVDLKGRETFRDKTVCSYSEDVYEVYKRFPELIIPFFSINPNRLDALDLIDKYVALGFKGAKFLQNFWDIDINDERYIPYFEKIKSYNLPLIIHTGSEHAIESNPIYEKIEIANLAIEVGCKVVIAHMGVDVVMEKRAFNLHHNFSFQTKNFGEDYHKTLEYLEKYDNVYADLSALIMVFRTKTIEDLAKNQKHLHHKLLFGTDYPVPFSIVFSYNSLSLKKRFEIENIKNPLDRYAKFCMEYFTKESEIFTNYKKLIDRGL